MVAVALGEGDQTGATNHMTPEVALDAASLIQKGKVYSLGRVYEYGMPLFGQRVFALRIPGAPTGGAYGKNQVIWHDEILTTEIGQVGTQSTVSVISARASARRAT